MRGSRKTRQSAAGTEDFLLRRMGRFTRHTIPYAEQAGRFRVAQHAVSPHGEGGAHAAKLLDGVEIAEVVGDVVIVEIDAEPSWLRFQELRDIRLSADGGGIRSGPVEASEVRRVVDRLAQEEGESQETDPGTGRGATAHVRPQGGQRGDRQLKEHDCHGGFARLLHHGHEAVDQPVSREIFAERE